TRAYYGENSQMLRCCCEQASSSHSPARVNQTQYSLSVALFGSLGAHDWYMSGSPVTHANLRLCIASVRPSQAVSIPPINPTTKSLSVLLAIVTTKPFAA